MRPLDYLFTPAGRRRLLWEAEGRLKGSVTFTYDGGLRITSPMRNRSARKAFTQGYNDPATFSWLDNYLKPGMTVLDVGANVGLYALFAAKRVHLPNAEVHKNGSDLGLVYAFEANPSTAEILIANAATNRIGNLKVVGSAVGAKKGTITFEADAKNIGASHVSESSELQLEPVAMRSDGPTLPFVPVVSLDEFAEGLGMSHASLIKLDLEGYEVKALDGMGNLLERSKDCAVLTEVSERQLARYGNTPDDIRDRLESLGYRAHQCFEGGLVPYDWSRRLGDALWLRSG